MPAPLPLKPGQLTLDQLRAIYQQQCAIELDPAARENVDASTRTVNEIIATSARCTASIPASACSPGPRLPPSRWPSCSATCCSPLHRHRAAARRCQRRPDHGVEVGSLARGFSGIRWEVIEALVKLYHAKVYPCIPSQGSVGASGDLAPLAHMSAVLIGRRSRASRRTGDGCRRRPGACRPGTHGAGAEGRPGADQRQPRSPPRWALRGLLCREKLFNAPRGRRQPVRGSLERLGRALRSTHPGGSWSTRANRRRPVLS